MYLNLTRNPVILDGRSYPARPQPITPIVIERDDSPHATLTGFRGPADLPFIPRDQSGQSTYILPRHPSSISYLPHIKSPGVDFKILDLERGQVDAASELDQMTYNLPQSAIVPVPELTYVRMVGGTHTINIENGPELAPISQGAHVWADGSVYIPPFTPAYYTGGEVLILPFDGRILREAERRYPDCFLAVLDEPREGQPTKLFLVKGPSGAWMLEAPPKDNEQDELEGLEDDPALIPLKDLKELDLSKGRENPALDVAAPAFPTTLEEAERTLDAFTYSREAGEVTPYVNNDTAEALGVDPSTFTPFLKSVIELEAESAKELKTEPELEDEDNTPKTDAELLAEKLHQIITSVEDLYTIVNGLIHDSTALESRVGSLESKTRQTSPSIDTGITDNLIVEGKKLLTELEPMIDGLRKKSQEAGRQWMRNTATGKEVWLFAFADSYHIVSDADGNLSDISLGSGSWQLIDGPTPKTLPGINGPDGD